VAEDGREIPIADIPHPLVDRVGTGPGDIAWSLTESRAPVIHLSPLRVNLLARATEQGRRVVLVTDEHSSLTHAFATVWRDAGGAWVVRAAGSGLRDGFTGRALESVEDVWLPRPLESIDDIAVGHLRPVRLEAMQITAIVSVRHPARASTVLGGPASALAEAGLGVPPRAWGPNEPVGAAWDRTALTEMLRDRMPGEAAVFAGGPGMAAVISAQRTRFGVEEMTHAQLGLEGPSQDEFTEVRKRIDDALRHLASTTMPLVALLLARPARRDLLVPPFLPPPPVPLTLLIGPPAVRSFDLDPAEMRERHGAESVGRPRVPGLLFDLGPTEPRAWVRLDEILGDLDRDQLDEALGLAGPRIDAERWDGGRGAQP
jgi:hypothetical protein